MGTRRVGAPRRVDRGAAFIEYALLLALFTVVAIPGLTKLRDGAAGETRATTSRIAGTPVGTTPPPTTRTPITTTTAAPTTTTTRPPTTTTTLLPSTMVIYAGPDARIAPGTPHTQSGRLQTADNPLRDSAWSNTGGTLSNTVTTNSGTLVDRTTTFSFFTNRPGRYYLALTGTNQSETRSDFAEVKVTSGTVTTSISISGAYYDVTNTNWYAYGLATLRNQFNEPVAGVTVDYRTTTSSGSTTNGTCVTNSSGQCGAWILTMAETTSWAEFVVTGLTWECLDAWNPLPAAVRSNRSGLSLVTTTTRAPTTTTTRPPTTTGATTTTGLQAATTSTPAVTTTKPPATTTTRRTING
jgi:Flp pilus assembly pilin Flp